MEGHARCVTSLACTTDGGHMLSGARRLPAPAVDAVFPGWLPDLQQ